MVAWTIRRTGDSRAHSNGKQEKLGRTTRRSPGDACRKGWRAVRDPPCAAASSSGPPSASSSATLASLPEDNASSSSEMRNEKTVSKSSGLPSASSSATLASLPWLCATPG